MLSMRPVNSWVVGQSNYFALKLKVTNIVFQILNWINLRFDYLAAHYYTATPQELMVILQDFSER